MPRRKFAGKRCRLGLGGGSCYGVLSQETKNQRITLFFRDFDQQAKENIQEMKKELDSLLQTAEKAFTVELLKMPIAIRKVKRKDLLSLREGEEVALAAAVTDCSLEDIANPKLVRTNSKKVKVTTIVEYEDAKHISAKKISKKISKTKLLASLSPGLNGKLNPLSRFGSWTLPSSTDKGLKEHSFHYSAAAEDARRRLSQKTEVAFTAGSTSYTDLGY
ncbi:borealin-2-like isoform X1 [Melopsittacus undulatus]|uniref:borealin-2-like isoform X2 n=1 Tax=Melopsittacus undulatus TaxID=13146 RepID=UPI00146C0CB8|nr:borealin-2-like isoform X2 [Melopsittacus undulatus]XP_033929248.1 borealin-2-like isoform X1 [Melopsittacus undulatus]